jgi:hypothetical protein
MVYLPEWKREGIYFVALPKLVQNVKIRKYDELNVRTGEDLLKKDFHGNSTGAHSTLLEPVTPQRSFPSPASP